MVFEFGIKDFSDSKLAQAIVDYLKKHKIESVTIKLSCGPKESERTFDSKWFDGELKLTLTNHMSGENAQFFYLDIPEINTFFQSFSYGVEVVSDQEDIKGYFSQFTIEED